MGHIFKVYSWVLYLVFTSVKVINPAKYCTLELETNTERLTLDVKWLCGRPWLFAVPGGHRVGGDAGHPLVVVFCCGIKGQERRHGHLLVWLSRKKDNQWGRLVCHSLLKEHHYSVNTNRLLFKIRQNERRIFPFDKREKQIKKKMDFLKRKLWPWPWRSSALGSASGWSCSPGARWWRGAGRDRALGLSTAATPGRLQPPGSQGSAGGAAPLSWCGGKDSQRCFQPSEDRKKFHLIVILDFDELYFEWFQSASYRLSEWKTSLFPFFQRHSFFNRIRQFRFFSGFFSSHLFW